VVKDGKTTVFALNLTNKAVPLTLKVNGGNYSGSVLHRAMAFATMAEERVLPLNADPLKTIKNGSGDIVLPKYSMSTILLSDLDVRVGGSGSGSGDFSVAISAPANNSQVTLGQTLALAANATTDSNRIAQVNFRVNGAFVKQDNAAPYGIDWKPAAVGSYRIDAVAIKQDGTRMTSAANTITVKSAAVITPPRSSAQSTSSAANGCTGYINVAAGVRTELTISSGACLRFDENLNGKTLQLWDSDSHKSCDFRGALNSVGGSGALKITSNYASGGGFTGRDVKITNAAGNGCNYVKIRAY
jgi:hypothetical protein